MKPKGREFSAEIKVKYTRFNPSDSIVDIDVENFVHFGGGDHHRVPYRNCPASQTCPRPASEEWPIVLSTCKNYLLNLIGVKWETDDHGIAFQYRSIF